MLDYSNSINSKSVMLTLTNDCNLACTYCYEHHKSQKTMSLITARSIIDAEMSANDGMEFVTIDLFGGEPFLAFETLKSVVEFIKLRNYKKPHTVFANDQWDLSAWRHSKMATRK